MHCYPRTNMDTTATHICNSSCCCSQEIWHPTTDSLSKGLRVRNHHVIVAYMEYCLLTRNKMFFYLLHRIKALNLSAKEVDSYMCVQRMHQNNVEFLSCYFPMMIISMMYYPTETFYASTVVLAGRMVTALGYYQGASKRVFGGWFHFVWCMVSFWGV